MEEAFEPRVYTPLPGDWLVLVTDVVSSTKAVAAGRYAEVNYLGAACIVAVGNALPELAVPSVFGGDGATLAVPPAARDTAVAALVSVRAWGRDAFGLELRVGVVPVAELARRGAALEVAKLEFSPRNTMAMFRGDGFDVADALVKADDGTLGFLVPASGAAPPRPDLTDLSCRWAPLASENGTMLCLMVGARAADIDTADAIYREALAMVDRVVGLGSVRSAPVKLTNLRTRLRLSAMSKEARGLPGPLARRWARVLLAHLMQAFTFWFDLHPGGFDPQRYRREVTLNADFRKVSGMLRLIVDCTASEADAVEAGLAAMHAEGRIDYGVHRASHAIMTCVTPDVDSGEHVHFIDGGGGGHWCAAREFKARRAAREAPPED